MSKRKNNHQENFQDSIEDDNTLENNEQIESITAEENDVILEDTSDNTNNEVIQEITIINDAIDVSNDKNNQEVSLEETNEEKLETVEDNNSESSAYNPFKNDSMTELNDDSKEKEKKDKKKVKVKKIDISEAVRYNRIEEGLSTEIVEQRILDGLTNENNTKATKTIPQIIVSNVFTFFNILMFIIAGFLISVNAWTDLVFLLIVTINIILGVVQEIRAKNMIDSLMLMAASTIYVIRDNTKREVGINEVVLDDIVLYETGNQICADSILIEGNIEVNESLLTGESDAIIKKPGDILYSGSFVVSGNCKCRVDKVGKDNYIEKLSNQAKQYKKPKSDLLNSLNLIIKVMSFPVVILGISLFISMTIRGNLTTFNFTDYFNGIGSYMDLKPVIRKTAGAMVGMIPSGLFLASSIALFLGVIKLAQRKVLVQELYCIEMLARVNCICLDKTGTITDGTMSVKNVIDFNTINGLTTKNVISAMLNALNDSNLTSQALKEKFGLGKRIKFVSSIPFSSQRKFQAVSFDKYGTYILGAPEYVLKEYFQQYKKEVEKYAALGYRVLCLVHRNGNIVDGVLPQDKPEIVSMILIEDNIRPDAINTIKYFKDSGVQVRVISGDNPITVSKISERAGVDNAESYISLDGLTDNEVIKAASKYTVFGRVSPAQKRLLVHTLKESGLTVAMTGDGVNDILALKEADCSIAVASGSDAARNCSHLVLLDSNFDSMPYVVAEGRRVINNVTSVASLFLTKTIFSLLLAIQALITGNYPISTNQLFLIDVLAIGIPSLILVNEPNNKPVQGKFLVNVIKKALPGALVILIISLIVFALQDSLNLDSTSLSTIIVIAATHTCLMVLYKACKPFTPIHKGLFAFCYSIFLIAIFAGPQFLEFKPLLSWAEYYSDSNTTEMITLYPEIEISKDNYYIVDGKVINLQTDNNKKTPTLSCLSYNGINYYAINNNRIDTEIDDPDVSYDAEGNIYFGGYTVVNDIQYTDDFEDLITIDSLGYVYYKNDALKVRLTKSSSYYNYSTKYGTSTDDDAIKQFRIMPTIELKSGEFVINGIQSSDYSYKAPDYLTSLDNVTITIDTSTYELLVNGKPITATLKDGTSAATTYKVSLPNVTTSADYMYNPGAIYLNATSTGESIFSLYGEKKTYVIGKTNYNFHSIYYLDSNSNYIELTKSDDTPLYYLVTYNSETSQNEIELYDFSVSNLVENGFKNYYSLVDGNYISIDVNNIENGISITAENNKSSYVLVIDNKIVDLGAYGTLNNSILAPVISVTESNHYIIDGYYTDYEVQVTELNPHKSSNNYLILGGQTTDYKISSNDISTQTGGKVTPLNTSSKILLLFLCLLATPLMRLFQYAVPWGKKTVQDVMNFLSKY